MDACQIAGLSKISKPGLYTYHQKVMTLLEDIPSVTLIRIPRNQNSKADALAKLAKELSNPEEDPSVQKKRILSPPYVDDAEDRQISSIDIERQVFINYFKQGRLPSDSSLASQIQRRALSYTLINDVLYRRSFDQMWLRCLDDHEARSVRKEIHEGLCGSGPKMKSKIKRLGYYWPTMTKDCMDFARKCHQCQIHGPVSHVPPNMLHPTIASWPFECWGYRPN